MVCHDGRAPEHVEGQGVEDTDDTPSRTSMWHHLWPPGCYRNCIAHPALHELIGSSFHTIAR